MTSVDDDPGSGVGTDEAAGQSLDLSPRPPEDDARRHSRRSGSPFVWVVLAAVVVGIGFVVFQGLSNATLYFRNVDEALEQRDDLGTRRFRLQGLVVAEAVTEGDAVTFAVAFNGAEVPVRSTAGLPSQFAAGQPVVMEGHFADQEEALFLADRILVKHDEAYEADYGDRISDARDGEDDAGDREAGETDGDTGSG